MITAQFYVFIGVLAIGSAAPEPLFTTALGSAGLSAGKGLVQVAGDTKVWTQGLDLAGKLVTFGTGIVANASETGAHIARVGLGKAANFSAAALSGGVGVAKDGLDLLKNVGGHFPSFGKAATVASNLGSSALDFVDRVGQSKLNLAKKGDRLLEKGNNLVQSGAQTVNSIAQKGVSAGKTVVKAVETLKGGVVGMGKGVVGKLTGGLLFGKNDKESKMGSSSSLVGSAVNSGINVGKGVVSKLTGGFLFSSPKPSSVNQPEPTTEKPSKGIFSRLTG